MNEADDGISTPQTVETSEAAGLLPVAPPQWVPLADLPAWVTHRYGVAENVVASELIEAVRDTRELRHRVSGIKPKSAHPRLPAGITTESLHDKTQRYLVNDWEAAETDWRRGTVGGWGPPSARERLPIEVEWFSVKFFAEIRLLRWNKKKAETKADPDWPWLTLWEVTALLAFGDASVAAPKQPRGPFPWGNAFKNKWGFALGGEPVARRAFPVRDIRYVLARTNWWRTRQRRQSERRECPLPPLKAGDRQSVRITLRRHGKPASQLRTELLTDIRDEQARGAKFWVTVNGAIPKIRRALAAGEIVGWGYEGHRLARTVKAGQRQPIPESFFARTDITIRADNWICSRTESDWCDVRFKQVDVHRVWPEVAPTPPDLVETHSGVDTPQQISSPTPRNLGGKPTQYDWDGFAKELVRLANTPDGLPDRASTTKYMREWCSKIWGKEPSDSTVRDKISRLYPDP